MRKIVSLKSFYSYSYHDEMLKSNPAVLVQLPKLHRKEIIRLDTDEVALLLDEVERGDSLTRQRKALHEKTRLRDLVVLTLLLGIGIRMSEYMDLNISDVDLKNGGIRTHRKGGKEVTICFGMEVEETLPDYLEEREHLTPESGHEDALFLSLQMKHISVRSMEDLVEKYAEIVTLLKRIMPHKLRSTYGTNLYRETGGIYLVVDVLGHTDVNATKRHHVVLKDKRRRSARNAMRLREQQLSEPMLVDNCGSTVARIRAIASYSQTVETHKVRCSNTQARILVN